MVPYSMLVNTKTISRKKNKYQKSVWNTFFNCIIQSHILHIRTIFLIIWAANKRHTDSYCNNKLFWYNLEDIGNERTKLRGRRIRGPSEDPLGREERARGGPPGRGVPGGIATKVCFVVGSFNSIDFFQGCFFYNSIGLSQVCRGQK